MGTYALPEILNIRVYGELQTQRNLELTMHVYLLTDFSLRLPPHIAIIGLLPDKRARKLLLQISSQVYLVYCCPVKKRAGESLDI